MSLCFPPQGQPTEGLGDDRYLSLLLPSFHKVQWLPGGDHCQTPGWVQQHHTHRGNDWSSHIVWTSNSSLCAKFIQILSHSRFLNKTMGINICVKSWEALIADLKISLLFFWQMWIIWNRNKWLAFTIWYSCNLIFSRFDTKQLNHRNIIESTVERYYSK